MQKKLIAIVEDNHDLRGFMAQVLRLEDFETIEFADGASAFAKMEAALKPNLILCDLLMKNSDGASLVASLKGSDFLGAVPVVLVSGVEDLALRAQELGVADCLRKPFGVDELIRTVQKLAL